MVTVGITGGIGSGKTYVCRMLAVEGFPVFYCDLEAHRLMHRDASLRDGLRRLVGEEVYNADGRLCKPVLSAYIRRGEAYAEKVNALVHPRVRDAFLKMRKAYGGMPPLMRPQALVMECALLYESRFDDLVELSVHVSAPQELRIRRLMARDGISTGQARQWMELQMPEEEKRRRADLVIDNDGETAPDLGNLLERITRRSH